MSKFFINRPIFAIVISIAITLIGLLSMANLPVARYPQITPPKVQVSTAYVGASSEVVATTVASVIEQQVMGVQDMDYMVSSSSNDGIYSLSVQFNQSTDPDMAAVNTQNRVQRALATLPSEVQSVGVVTTKSSGGMDYIFALTSPNGTYDSTFLKNYGSNYMMNAIKAVKGVGSVQEFGSDYAMRIWLNPQRMALYGVTVADVTTAIRGQNLQAAAGTIGASPVETTQQFQYTVKVQGRLVTPEEFGNIIVKKDSNGNLLHLKDVATINLGAKDYGFEVTRLGQQVAGFAVALTSDANALETIGNVKKVIEEQSKSFPNDLEYHNIVDNTAYVNASIKEVRSTFIEALILVLIIVYVFLQSWKSTVIPMIAVPVSLLGTFAAFVLLGFSINTLTLFAMVLAIGLVVDDAIVVIEAVEYEMKVNGLPPKEASIRAMEQVQGPVIGIAFVLSAVFIPVSFMGGMTGILYKQFALTIAVSVMISAFIALTLTPALCGMMLKPHVEKDPETEPFFTRILHKFNLKFDRFTEWYGHQLEKLSHRLSLTVIALITLTVLSAGVFKIMPTSFVPSEDSGYFMVSVNLPPGSTLSRTQDTMLRVADFVTNKNPYVDSAMAVTGFDILSESQKSSGGVIFATLTPWEKRTAPGSDVNSQIGRVFGYAAQAVPEASVLALNPPSIPGLGSTGGASMYIINKAGESTEQMIQATNALLGVANQDKRLARAYTTFNNMTPGYQFDVNREKAAKDGVAVADIYSALQAFYGSMQVNDFTEFGKNYKVVIQAEQKFRESPDMNRYIYVRNSTGNMVAVDNYIIPKQQGVVDVMTRFNNYPAVKITANGAPGVSSGDVIAALEDAAKALPRGYEYDWSDQSREEVKAGSQTMIILGMGFIFVFLVLAALYESWKVPFSVLLSVPSGIFGASLFPYIFGQSNDIYVQIGLLTLVGLAAKNAILIVEYAKIRVDEQGMTFTHAAVEAAKIRLRPIVMTSMAFILGCLPLALATGAGAASRTAMGITVVAGMSTATLLGIFIIPMLFIIIEKLGNRDKSKEED